MHKLSQRPHIRSLTVVALPASAVCETHRTFAVGKGLKPHRPEGGAKLMSPEPCVSELLGASLTTQLDQI